VPGSKWIQKFSSNFSSPDPVVRVPLSASLPGLKAGVSRPSGAAMPMITGLGSGDGCRVEQMTSGGW